MEKSNESLAASSEEWNYIVKKHLTPLIFEGFQRLYEEAVEFKEETQDPKYDNFSEIHIFQEKIKKIPDWNQLIIDKETERIVQKSKHSDLENIVNTAILSRSKLLTIGRNKNPKKRIVFEVPKLRNFIHRCYIECGRELYQESSLFDPDDISFRERQKNIKEIKLIIKECIDDTIRFFIDTSKIIKNFYDNDPETENTSLTMDSHYEEEQLRGFTNQLKEQIERKIASDMYKKSEESSSSSSSDTEYTQQSRYSNYSRVSNISRRSNLSRRSAVRETFEELKKPEVIITSEPLPPVVAEPMSPPVVTVEEKIILPKNEIENKKISDEPISGENIKDVNVQSKNNIKGKYSGLSNDEIKKLRHNKESLSEKEYKELKKEIKRRNEKQEEERRRNEDEKRRQDEKRREEERYAEQRQIEEARLEELNHTPLDEVKIDDNIMDQVNEVFQNEEKSDYVENNRENEGEDGSEREDEVMENRNNLGGDSVYESDEFENAPKYNSDEDF